MEEFRWCGVFRPCTHVEGNWKVVTLMKLGRLLERSDMTERFDPSGYCDDLAALLLWRIDYCFVSLSDRI